MRNGTKEIVQRYFMVGRDESFTFDHWLCPRKNALIKYVSLK